jgi:hypothetical protein
MPAEYMKHEFPVTHPSDRRGPAQFVDKENASNSSGHLGSQAAVADVVGRLLLDRQEQY